MTKVMNDGNVSDIREWEFPELPAQACNKITNLNAHRIKTPDLSAAPTPQTPEINEPPATPVAHNDQNDAYQQAIKEGFTIGHQEGVAMGRKQAYEDTKHQISEEMEKEYRVRIMALESLMQKMQQPLSSIDNAVETQLMQLVKRLVKRLVQHEIQLEPAAMKALIQQAIDCMPIRHGAIRIYLQPNTLELVKEFLPEHMIALLHGDEQLSQGDIRIEHEHAQVDASIDNRLTRLLEEAYEHEHQE